MKNILTFDLNEFGYRELSIAKDILTAMLETGLPVDFNESGIKIAFNTLSGYVFLTNDEYQVAVLEGKYLESFYVTPYDGHEGTLEELLDSVDDGWHIDDLEYLINIIDIRDFSPLTTLEYKLKIKTLIEAQM